MKALAVIDRYFDKEDVKLLTDRGIEVDCFLGDEEHAVIDNPEQYDMLIAGLLLKFVPIENFPNLKFFQIMTAGFDYLNGKMDYIREKGIIWHRAEGIHTSIAEHAIGGLLDIYRQRRFFEEAQRNHVWTHTSDRSKNECFYECSHRRVLIVGAGKIGTEIAKRLQAFNMDVYGIATKAGDREGYNAVYAMEDLDREIAKADVVVVSLPNNKDTFHVINKDRLDLMKDDAVLINIARGALVDEKALIETLQSGKLKGAVLDVFETEPLPEDSPLWDMPNVVLSGHLAGRGDRKKERFMKMFEKNLDDFLDSQR